MTTKSVIEGRIIDTVGAPVSNVAIKVTGTRFMSVTDAVGNYRIEYVPGVVNLEFQKDGYLPEFRTFNIQVNSLYPAEEIQIIQYPDKIDEFLKATFLAKRVKLIYEVLVVSDYITIDQIEIVRTEASGKNLTCYCSIITTAKKETWWGHHIHSAFHSFTNDIQRAPGDRFEDQFEAIFTFEPNSKEWRFVGSAHYGEPLKLQSTRKSDG